MPVDVPGELGTLAMDAAARKFGLEQRAQRAGWWDARHKSNGGKVQVKGALYERAGGAPGVVRVWRENLELLEEAGGSVVVVVTNPENPQRKVLRVAKTSPSTLLELGDFRATGQASMRGKHEARIAWNRVVTL